MEHAVTHYSGGPHEGPPPGPSGPPGPGPAQGGGRGGGWGGGWAPPPEAPKPGVVPLRPLGVGDILNGTFAAFGRHWAQLIGIAALAYGAALAVTGGAVALALSWLTDEFQVIESALRDGADSRLVTPFTTLAWTFAAVALIGSICLLLATALTQAASPAVLQEAVLGRRTTFGAVWGRAVRRLPAVLGALLLPWAAGLLVAGLLATGYVALMFALLDGRSSGTATAWAVTGLAGGLLLVPLAVWLWVRFTLAPAVAVFEGAGPVQALRRSALLVRGAWWRTFGISLLAMLMAAVASWLIQIPFSLIGMFSMLPSIGYTGSDEAAALQALTSAGWYLLISLLGGFVSQIVVAFVPQLTTGLLYVDRRFRSEGLAPTLAEAAYGPPQY
ncbi:hypothetical protein ACIQM4_20795 [Streptomyces sp. NPDC091272]|uniref:DUF7847 domain-containing protein n=1 Tax=Streptomyces sp. NPDC091272 TaxID=3365981 RepID=UPI00382F409E